MSRIEVCGATSRANVSKTSGKLEVLELEDDVSPGIHLSMSRMCMSDSPDLAAKPINFQNGKLQVLGPKEKLDLHSGDAASRSGRQGSAGRKCYIPTKQISLCTVKPIAQSSHIPDYSAADSMQSEKPEYSTVPKASQPQITDKKVTAGLHSPSIHNHIVQEHSEESSGEDESDEEGGAPVELLAEFLKAVMDEDYIVAQKLCQMVLIYEPENPEAKEFSPLIEKMLQNEEQQSSDDGDSEEPDDEDEDSSDTDDSDDQSNVTSEDSSEDEMDK